jgi:site-specific DNA-methyltransferase (adenine-specific)
MRVEQIGDATLYCCDCMDLLPTLPKVDAVITDPPYGMCHIPGNRSKTPKQKDGHFWGKKWAPIIGDDSPFDPKPFTQFDAWILWGANHFCEALPSGKTWLAWTKGTPTGMSYSDCELACTSLDGGGVRNKGILWSGFRREVDVREHYHPTQKPTSLMTWCLELLGKPQTILDPFMGSGTTGVACAQLGRKFIGIEIEPKYYEIALRRIEDAYRQKPLFEPEPTPAPVQGVLA